MRISFLVGLLSSITFSFGQDFVIHDKVLDSLKGNSPSPLITLESVPATKKVTITCSPSLPHNNSPLIIVNGLVVDDIEGLGLNPDEITSIDVIKDTAASGIYGYRARRGAIVVTTVRLQTEIREEISIFPNPTAGAIQMTGEIGQYKLLNSTGSLALQSYQTIKTKAEAEISEFLESSKGGIYFLQVGDKVIRIKKN